MIELSRVATALCSIYPYHKRTQADISCGRDLLPHMTVVLQHSEAHMQHQPNEW